MTDLDRGAGKGVRVVWTRGHGCSELAEILGERPTRVNGDLAGDCIAERADILVSRRLPGSFDLVNVAVPLDFAPEKVTKVVSAVAGGPHSRLAAETAALIARRLGVPAEMVSAVRPGEGRADADDLLGFLTSVVDDISGRVVEVADITKLVESLDDGTLLVLGAPGGSWLQRSMFGPGARLKSKAPAGVVMVRSVPDRVFRWMGEPVFVGPLRLADDTLRVHTEHILAVADRGRLIGLVRRERLQTAGDGVVGSVMEEAVSARVDDTLEAARELEPTFGRDPIPVTDHQEHLVGGLLLPVA